VVRIATHAEHARASEGVDLLEHVKGIARYRGNGISGSNVSYQFYVQGGIMFYSINSNYVGGL